jgi:uncharacterized protein
MEFYQLVIIILTFSAIQSIVGVGLLLFGTPSLLLLGYSYPEVLWILLPASCSLSLMQVIEGYEVIDSKKKTYFLTMPALVFSLILVIKLDYIFDIKKIVGLFLVGIALLRLSAFSKAWAVILLEKYKKSSYVLIGLIHGLSNLGGALLSVVVSATHTDKQKINANIAFVYFNLALSQLVVLSIFESNDFSVSYLVFVPVVLTNHLILSRKVTDRIDNDTFKRFVNLVVLVFGVICLV